MTDLEIEIALEEERLHSLAQPCFVLGLTAVILAGGFYLYYFPRAYDMDLLIVSFTGYVVVGGGLWTMANGAALWWLRRPDVPRYLVLVVVTLAAAIGGGLIFANIIGHPLGAVGGLFVGGWVPAAESISATRLTRLHRRARSGPDSA